MNSLPLAALLVLISAVAACGDNGGEPADAGPGPDGDPSAFDASPDPGGPPTVVSTGPADDAVGVSVNTQLEVRFIRAMDPATLDDGTFTLRRGATAVAGTVRIDGAVATFTPGAPLALAVEHTATVSTDAEDLAGMALTRDHVWTFTTGDCSQPVVDLRTASSFAVLAGSQVTSTGQTVVTGDLGVSPGTQVTGFLPGVVVGTQHAGNATAAQAMANLTLAYDDVAGRTRCPVAVAGNIGGRTLTPGLYKSTSTLAVSSGDLTLDAQGDADAVFVFQVASSLLISEGRRIVLAGGARAGNVFWQAGTSAAIGTGADFVGTVMADQSVTVATGASVDGRLLARIALVSLQANVVTRPVL